MDILKRFLPFLSRVVMNIKMFILIFSGEQKYDVTFLQKKTEESIKQSQRYIALIMVTFPFFSGT